MTIAEMMNERERRNLSEFACLSSQTKGRVHPIKPCTLRTEFQRDREDNALQVFQASYAQNSGFPLSRRRSLPYKAYAHARSYADSAYDSEGEIGRASCRERV